MIMDPLARTRFGKIEANTDVVVKVLTEPALDSWRVECSGRRTRSGGTTSTGSDETDLERCSQSAPIDLGWRAEGA